MNGLEDQFSDEIEFVWLDIDDSSSLPTREKYGIVQRTRYILVDESDTVILRWFGPLNEASITAEVADWLATQG